MAVNNKGIEVAAWQAFRDKAAADPSKSDRVKTAVARWVQGEEAHVEMGGHKVIIGADDGLNMMEMLLVSFAACDAAVVAVHASYLGLAVNDVTVEVSGHFNVASYVGVEGAAGPGYDSITTHITLDAPGVTPEQLAHLKRMCEQVSPVGDTLTRNVAIELDVASSE